ncbi:MAG: hypothetical protein HFJ45_05055 [Clostridia bacterium]|nr:hypothetical protein [Clostridia bacterium]
MLRLRGKIAIILILILCYVIFYFNILGTRTIKEEVVENGKVTYEFEEEDVIKYIDKKEEESKKSQNVQFKVTIYITMFSIFTSAIISILSLIVQCKENKKENCYKIMEILPETIEKMNIIITILLKDNRYKNIIDTIDSKTLSEFNIKEIQEIFEHDNKGKPNIFNQIEKIICYSKTQDRYEKYLKENYREEKYKEIFPKKYTKLIEDTLDKMNFLCEIIIINDSKFIYEQYNTIILDSICKLSIIIAKDNKNIINKKYIKIIKLYNKWNKKEK